MAKFIKPPFEDEVWKEVKGYDGQYLISNYGRIKSNKRNKDKYQLLILQKTKYGHPNISLCKNNTKKSVCIHRIVAEAFIPNPENKREVNHKDGNKTNNHVSNLEWCTRGENIRHAVINGLHRHGPNQNTYTKEMVLKMRSMFKEGCRVKDIAQTFSAKKSTVSMIVNRKIWRHI